MSPLTVLLGTFHTDLKYTGYKGSGLDTPCNPSQKGGIGMQIHTSLIQTELFEQT